MYKWTEISNFRVFKFFLINTFKVHHVHWTYTYTCTGIAKVMYYNTDLPFERIIIIMGVEMETRLVTNIEPNLRKVIISDTFLFCFGG